MPNIGDLLKHVPVSVWIVFWSLVIVGSIVLLTYLDTNVRPRLTIAPGGRMQLWKAIVLLLWLSGAGAVSVGAVYGLWRAEPHPPIRAPATEPADCKPGDPEVRKIDPEEVFLGLGRSSIRIMGCNFTRDDTVSFDGVERVAVFVDDKQLSVPLATSDFGATGTVLIGVAYPSPPVTTPAATPAQPNPPPSTGKKTSNQMPLQIQSAAQQTMPWNFFGTTVTINQELRLLLLVLFAGCLGSATFALKSVADYVGDQKLYESWFAFYLVQPLEGGGIAFIFYVVLRGGLFTGSTIDVKAGNQWGIIAIAALVGVFSDQAFAKLREVFETLFRPQDARSGKIAGVLSIQTGSPLPDATAGATYKQSLGAVDGSPPYAWAAATIPALPAGLTLNAAGDLSGTPTAAVSKTKYTFKVTDTNGASALKDLELTVNAPPAISTPSPLPNAKVNDGYNVQLVATDGTPPYTWDQPAAPTQALPVGMTLNPSGKIGGKPGTPANSAQYQFKVTDANGASTTKTLELTVIA